jgi:hypothetical protein
MSKESFDCRIVLTKQLGDALLKKLGTLIEPRKEQFVERGNYKTEEQKNKAQAYGEIKDEKHMDSPLGNSDIQIRRRFNRLHSDGYKQACTP